MIYNRNIITAARTQALAKTRNAEILNKIGLYREYKIGDRVSFYIPPAQDEVVKARRRPKHLLQYRGPATVVAVLSPNRTTYRLYYKGRHYERSILNIHPYKSDSLPQMHNLTTDQSITIGSYVACLDDIDDDHYHIARVLSIVDDIITVWYYGTKHSILRHAVWKPLWHDEHTDSVGFHKPTAINLDDLKFTGSFSLSYDKDQLIIIPNIGFTSAMKINSSSRKLLEQCERMHHIRGTTWTLIGKRYVPSGTRSIPKPSKRRIHALAGYTLDGLLIRNKRHKRRNRGHPRA